MAAEPVPIQVGQVWESRIAPGYRLRVVERLDDGRWLAERVDVPPASASGLQLGETTPVSERQLQAGDFDLADPEEDPYRAYRERAQETMTGGEIVAETRRLADERARSIRQGVEARMGGNFREGDAAAIDEVVRDAILGGIADGHLTIDALRAE